MKEFGNVAFRRVRIKSREPLQLQGTKASALKNIRMEDVSGTVEAVKAIDVVGVQGLDMKGFSVTSGAGAKCEQRPNLATGVGMWYHIGVFWKGALSP